MSLKPTLYAPDTAASKGYVGCGLCNLVYPKGTSFCSRCGSGLKQRDTLSIQKTLALLVTAMAMYIPANTFPIMTTTLFGDSEPSTILGGVIIFLNSGSYFVALVIFTASVLIPLAKMCAIMWICFRVKQPQPLKHGDLSKLYHATEWIGKWSMIDVFVVAILVALVQVQGVITIEPGPAASAFASVVILTMVAANQFDTRLIWDRWENE